MKKISFFIFIIYCANINSSFAQNVLKKDIEEVTITSNRQCTMKNSKLYIQLI